MRKLSYISQLLFVVIACVALQSCNRHRYYDAPATAGRLLVEFDWNGYTDIPPGMNLLFYPIDASTNLRCIPFQLQFDGGEISLPVGRYNLIVFNDYTYNILYSGMEDFFTAKCYLGDYNRKPLSSRAAPQSRNVAEPDMFYSAHIYNISVTGSKAKVIKVHPVLHTATFIVHVKVDGIKNVSMADGALSGIASSIMLSNGISSDIVPNNRIFQFAITDDGMEAETKAFLMSDPMERKYTLDLAFLLRNNNVTFGTFIYDVSDQVIKQLADNDGKIPLDGIHIFIDDVVIEDVVSSGGFDVAIDGWGGYEVIELQ